MTGKELAEKVTDIAKNYKTLYVMGCFGSPLNAVNRNRYCNNHIYNKQATRTKMIQAATPDTFGFDCVCLIKGVLWGWNGDEGKTYGGAKYASNGVPDIAANGMIQRCSDVTTNFSNVQIGEALWCEGHIGVYIGDGLAVECTPSWKNCVQITAVGNIGTKAGYPTRHWVKHGKLPWVSYEQKTTVAKTESARSFSKSYSKAYKVTANALNMRYGAGTNKQVMTVLKKGATFRCYGYYTKLSDGSVWLYGIADGKTGFCSTKYLV